MSDIARNSSFAINLLYSCINFESMTKRYINLGQGSVIIIVPDNYCISNISIVAIVGASIIFIIPVTAGVAEA